MKKDFMLHHLREKKWCSANLDIFIEEKGVEFVKNGFNDTVEAFLIDYEDGLDLGDALMLAHYGINEPRYSQPPLTIELVNFLKAKYAELFVL